MTSNPTGPKISFLINSLAGGGAEGVCVNLANTLADAGWQLDLVVMHMNNATYLDRLSENINLVDLKTGNARFSFGALKRYIKLNRVERLLVFNYELAVLLVLIRKFSFLNFKIYARNINTLSQKKNISRSRWRNSVVLPMINRFYSQADHIINQCRAMEQDLLDVFPQLNGKTSVIYNPVNKIIENAAKNIDFSKVEKQNYLLCVGRLEEQKAFHYAIKAFARLNIVYPDLRLKIVGQGRLETQLKDEAIRLRVIDKVDFEGFQKEIIPYYLHAKATILTSLFEGFPNVLVESIVLGTPVVSFDCKSGPAEIIESGVNGILVEHLNVDHLYNSLKRVLSGDIRFSPEKYIKRYGVASALVEYEDILSEKFGFHD